MANILILEDDPKRVKKFNQLLHKHNVVVTDKVDECIKLLKTRRWNALFLDHDLDGKVYVPSGPGTGYEVACWLEKHTDRMPTRIIVHSYNGAGADKMLQALPRATYEPGVWLEEKITL